MNEMKLYQSNEEAISTGLSRVKPLFSRLARIIDNNPPDPEDEHLNDHLDTWFEAVVNSHQGHIKIPLVEFVKQEGLTQIEVYIILILLGVHYEAGLKEACASLRGHSLLKSPSQTLLIDLLCPTSIQKIHLYTSGLFPVIFNNERYVIHNHDEMKVSSESSISIAQCLIQRLLGLRNVPKELKIKFDNFYHITNVKKEFFIFDDSQKKEIVSICKQYCHEQFECGLRFFVYGQSGKDTFARFLAASLKYQLCTLNVAELLSQPTTSRQIQDIFKEIEQHNSILYIRIFMIFFKLQLG